MFKCYVTSNRFPLGPLIVKFCLVRIELTEEADAADLICQRMY